MAHHRDTVGFTAMASKPAVITSTIQREDIIDLGPGIGFRLLRAVLPGRVPNIALGAATKKRMWAPLHHGFERRAGTNSQRVINGGSGDDQRPYNETKLMLKLISFFLLVAPAGSQFSDQK